MALVSERETDQMFRYQGKYEALVGLTGDLQEYLKKGDN